MRGAVRGAVRGAARHALPGRRTSSRGKAEESKVAAVPTVKQRSRKARARSLAHASVVSSYLSPNRLRLWRLLQSVL